MTTILKTIVLVDDLPLPLDTEIAMLLASNDVAKIKVGATPHRIYETPISLFSRDEGRTWCRGWDDETIDALTVAGALR